MKGFQVPKPSSGRRLVISDIHGCIATFDALLQKIHLTQADQLFLLGDYIDRGPDSGAVIDLILDLQSKGFQMLPIRGNHEDLFLDAYQEYNSRMFKAFLRIQKCVGLTDKQGRVKPHYLEFMRSLPYYYELDNFFLVHAGFNCELDNPFEDIQSMIWIRRFRYDATILKNKTVIHGHTPFHLEDIIQNICQKSKVIGLDNGCVYRRPSKIKDYKKLGKLCCLNLDTYELVSVENQDIPQK